MYVRKSPPIREDKLVPTAVGNPPYATLLTFSRYVGRTGPAKATFVGGLRRARQDRAGFNPHFGLCFPDGRREVVRLHFDEQPPADELVAATLQLMVRQMAQILPRGRPVLVDVRRGTPHRLDPKVPAEEVERWLAGEALAFSAMWRAAA